jgi:hypothetical protein
MTEQELAEEFARADAYSLSLLLKVIAEDSSFMDEFAYCEETGYRADQAIRRWWRNRYPEVWYKLYRAWQRSGVDGEERYRPRTVRRKGKWDL